MNNALENALDALSTSQRRAVEWKDGPALVLAGPGVGKTTVLTARLARILDSTAEQRFRILALTFTTKAGDEMRTRVDALVPGLADRATIGTFHSFCAQTLRQHGSHLRVRPDFSIYDQDRDREELLRDALRVASTDGKAVSEKDVDWLKTIDKLRAGLIEPSQAPSKFRDPAAGAHVAVVYEIYQAALRASNVMDFNGLILDTCRLLGDVPAVANRIRQTNRYWMIDEFQDTSPAQYQLVRLLAGESFRNVFAVADDDQIIYQWAGASYRQIETFRSQFKPELFQLVENRRCPPDVVQAANALIKQNSERTPDKAPLVALRAAETPSISLQVFATDAEEAKGVALGIADLERDAWGRTAVLARTRALLTPILAALKDAGITAAVAMRRDRFASPQFVWLQACLDQSIRPTDRHVFVAMVDAANRFAGMELDPDLLHAQAEAFGRSPLEQWSIEAEASGGEIARRLAAAGNQLLQSRSAWQAVVDDALAWLANTAAKDEGGGSDAAEDKASWENAARAIRAERGAHPALSELLQGIAMRSKEPPSDPGAVTLLTIHSAKGLEFDYVWLVGLAESVLPSWQSLQPAAKPSELEEERRNCFVAITRTRMALKLSRAEAYGRWLKEPSRFLAEMGM